MMSDLNGFGASPTVATISATDEELTARHVRFQTAQPSGDEAGPIEVGTLRVLDGRVDLVRHVGHPELGVEVRSSVDADPADIAQAVTVALGLPPSRTTWVRAATSVRAAEGSSPYGPA